VVARAQEVLSKLEAEDRATPKGFDDLPLFATTPKPAAAREDGPLDQVVKALAALNPDEMSPREAMEALYRLKAGLPKT
jgi:DNA mismatch repair protein MutS